MNANPLPIINLSTCTRCGACVTHCPENALVMEADGPGFKASADCTYCTVCESLCPTGAIRAPLTVHWSPQA